MNNRRIIGKMEINRKTITDYLLDNYNKIEINKSSENIDFKQTNPPVQIENDLSNNMLLQEFKSNVKIVKNGKEINDNYYPDYQQNTISNNYNPLLKKNKPKINKETKVQPGQIDPNEFFNSSLNGFIKKVK